MTTQTANKGIWAWDLVKWVIGFSVLYLVGIFVFDGFTEESVRRAIRVTARISPVLFCMAFMATSFHLLIRNSTSFWVMMNRRYWGISFGIMHLIHLFFLWVLHFSFQPLFVPSAAMELIFGGIAYLFIFLMLFTSFDIFKKWLSPKNWTRLHTFGSIWIWGVFMNSIWGRIIVKGLYAYIPLGLLLVVAMGLRVWRYFKKN